MGAWMIVVKAETESCLSVKIMSDMDNNLLPARYVPLRCIAS
jgi:hypothetical protein